ncbi:hypothetical protein LuPra_02423 [Luteitalea pratensis]|uniref:Uncharacterized protein n=1 Tax=Luteitalea pratensis TaxID=1855912 RepID=A0A143PM09_LUTPR|nr:hypothetical protein [Luteitalea pratensis]AMY09210.1 hypothetical protein LuPra_02423 [Luteitalea pratensis]
MATKKYIVLHANRGLGTGEPFSGGVASIGASATTAAPVAQVEVTDLTEENVRDLARDPEVAAITLPMPLTIIAPHVAGVAAL